MNLHGKIPVEPLDDERLTNIERKLVVAVSEMRAPARRAPGRLLAFAGVAMAVLVAGFVGWKLRGDGVAPATDSVETFAVNTDDGNTVQLGNERLGAIALTSGAATDLRVERSRDRVIVNMQRGSIDMAVEHKPGRLLVVRAGDTEIEDVGTRFTVDYDGKDRLEVRVTEGEVKVKRGGKHADVKAGFAWSLDAGTVVTLAELDAKRVARATGVTPSDDPIEIDPVPPHAGSATTTASAGSAATAHTPTTTSHAGSGATVASKKPGTPNARKALLAAQLDAPEDVGTTDPKAAHAKYLELIRNMPESEDKARLHYSMAYVQHMAKNDTAAKSLIRGVLARQGGPAYRSALWLNVRIQCLKAFDDECRRAAELYRRKFPDGMHTGVADAILTEIGRQ